MTKLLVFGGSLRQHSFNHQLAQAIVDQLDPQVEVTWANLSAIPFLNQDLETPVPAAVQTLRDQVLAADKLLIVSPEYNESIPAYLKNALDWLSRPMDLNDRHSAAASANKPVAIAAAAGKDAGLPVRQQLDHLVRFIGMQPITESLGIALPVASWTSGDLILDADAQTAVANFAHALG